MGKVRVKVIGEEESEPKKKKSYEERKTIQRAEAAQTQNEKPSDTSDEEDDTSEKTLSQTTDAAPEVEKTEVKTKPAEEKSGQSKYAAKTAKKAEKKTISKKYSSNFGSIDKNRSYELSDAVKLLKGFKASKFDETVELHVNVKEEGLSGTVSLPHGTGKEVRIKVADETVIAEIEKGKIDFDVLIASPSLMPLLAKVAKVLGPRGLMPNPKNGTITDDPKPLIEKLSKGQIRFKTEAKAPVIHLSVGKVSFDADKLSENITTVLTAVGTGKISKVTLKSTMSPGIKVLL